PPGPDTFDVRWRIPGVPGSLTDIRDILGAATDPVIFRLVIGGAPQEYPLTIGWNRTSLPAGGWRIRDSATSGSLVNADMWLSDQIHVPDTGIRVLEIVHSKADTTRYTLAGKWNLVSLPVDPADRSVAGLYPDASPEAYAYATEYVAADSLIPGRGYWIRNAGAGMVIQAGVPFVSTTVANPSGDWVLFGTIYCPVARIDLCPGCPDVPVVFGYDNGYFLPDTLYPGAGYWYHGSGELKFACSGTPGVAPKPGATDPLEDLDLIRISDASGASAALYIGPGSGRDGARNGRFLMPPLPPAPVFDARFENQEFVEYFTIGNHPAEKSIVVSHSTGNLTITYRPAGNSGRRYTVGVPGAGTSQDRLPLHEEVPLRVSLPGGGRILLSASGVVPTAFRLYHNYPNPFNPRTTIVFDLPAEASVTMRVRSVTGREVDAAFVGRPMQAGSHSVEYDASGLASGVYFYSLTAAETGSGRVWRSTGKFLLIR
ncbi:MAG TPA: T9SS type A sorting domain-containing protein, partial [Bacteroidota bacterium]|nr:T9SS type A sorting domain-containing protein [Bacteroidota bacterium]